MTASLAGCSKETVGSAGQPADQQLVESSLSATLTVPGGDTKVALGGDQGLSPLWETGDQILVLDADMKPVGPDGLFTISGGTGTQTGTFDGEAYMLQTPTYAIYPASAYDATTGKFTLPATQNGTKKSAFKDNAVMLGKISKNGNTFATTFTNVCSVLKINTGDYGKSGGDPAIKYVTVNAASGLAGEFTIDWEGATPTISPATEGAEVSTMASSGSYAANTDIYIPVIPTGSQTFDFDFNNTEGKYASVSETIAAAANTINALGTAGGMEFKPQTLPGVFSVSATKKVQFSKGNLWADSSNALHFESKQWKSTPESNGPMDSYHVSHFTWSSTVADAVSDTNSGDYLFCDENHMVSVGGSEAIYYAFSKDEWTYLFETRPEASSKYGFATVADVPGIIILPDEFTDPKKNNGSGLFVPKSSATGWSANTYAAGGAWGAMETAGAVFLPITGYRSGSAVHDIDYVANRYWSSTAYDSRDACVVYFDYGGAYLGSRDIRFFGLSVRLITDCQ